jgi:hypothetical protein
VNNMRKEIFFNAISMVIIMWLGKMAWVFANVSGVLQLDLSSFQYLNMIITMYRWHRYMTFVACVESNTLETTWLCIYIIICIFVVLCFMLNCCK